MSKDEEVSLLVIINGDIADLVVATDPPLWPVLSAGFCVSLTLCLHLHGIHFGAMLSKKRSKSTSIIISCQSQDKTMPMKFLLNLYEYSHCIPSRKSFTRESGRRWSKKGSEISLERKLESNGRIGGQYRPHAGQDKPWEHPPMVGSFHHRRIPIVYRWAPISGNNSRFGSSWHDGCSWRYLSDRTAYTKLVNSVLRLLDSCNSEGIAVLNLRPKSFMRKREFHFSLEK